VTVSRAELTEGWTDQQRRLLIEFLTPQQKNILRERIRRIFNGYDEDQKADAIAFINSEGNGESHGIAEYEAACLFGSDPAFVNEFRRIRRINDPSLPALTAYKPSVKMSGMEYAAKLHGNLGKRGRKKK
jgi:hypothetical protein